MSAMGPNSLVSVDTDSDPAAEMTIVVLGLNGLAADDFIL